MALITNILTGERTRVMRQLTKLRRRQLALEQELTTMRKRGEVASEGYGALTKLTISAEQAAMASQINLRLIAQKAKRLKEVQRAIDVHNHL